MPINPQINDMPWFGKPADPVGAYQQGQNLAEQSQRMKQSADMHPLKMADMKSATSARDANTNLSKQSYQFNELTQADRVSSVNALSRMQQVSAGIAENTQTAVENLKKSQAWNQSRSDEVRKNIKVELEVQAKEAGHNRAITNQWVNEQTKQGQVDQFNHRTNLLGQQAKAATLQNDVNYANKTLMTEAQTHALQNQINGFKVAQRNYELALKGEQPLQEGKIAMQGMSPAQLNALQVPQGLQPEQVSEWKSHRNALLDNFQGREYKAATEAARTHRKKTYTSAQPYSDALSGVGLATVDQNGNLQIDPRNAAKVDMFIKQKELLKDVPQEIQDRILMQATETNDPVALFSETEPSAYGTVQGPLPAQSLAGKNAAIYGTKHGGEFVLNERGMSRLGPLVAKYKTELANARLQSQVTQMTQGLGLPAESAKLGADGKPEITFKSTAMTSDQKAKNLQAAFDGLLKSATDAGQEVTPKLRQELFSEARRQTFANDMHSASNAAEARRNGLVGGVPYWNHSALNADGTRGGVRQAGQEGEDGTLNVHGQPETPAPAPATPAPAPKKEGSADDEFKKEQQKGSSGGASYPSPWPQGLTTRDPSPPSSKKLVGTPYLVDQLKKGQRKWTSFQRKMLDNAGWNPDTGENLRAAGGSTEIKPTVSKETPKAEGLPNQYDTGPLRDLGISAVSPSMNDITLRSASQRLRLGIPLNQEEINALVNKHPIPKDMPSENMKVINAARSGEKLPPQEKAWLKEMNIDPETGIPMGKVKIVRLPPRPTLNPKR